MYTQRRSARGDQHRTIPRDTRTPACCTTKFRVVLTLLAPISPTLFPPSSSLPFSLLVPSSVGVRAIEYDVSLGEEAEERVQGETDRAESRKPTLRCFISRDLSACHGDRRGSANDRRRIVRLMTSPLKNAPLRIRYANRVIGFSVYVGRALIAARNRARFTADPIVAIIFFILFDFSVLRDVARCRDVTSFLTSCIAAA